MNTAEIILNQLGGNKFIVMTGSKNFVNTGKGLRMKLTRNKAKAQYLTITLNAMDTYDMTFIKVRKSDFQITEVAKSEGVYCDQLTKIFEQVTGLYTSL